MLYGGSPKLQGFWRNPMKLCSTTPIQSPLSKTNSEAWRLFKADSIRAKLIRHNDTRRAPTFQKLEQKPPGGGLVSPGLDEKVEHVTIRIDRSP